MQDDTTTNEENQELDESQEVDEQNEQDVQEVDNQEESQDEQESADESQEDSSSEERPPSRRESKRIQQLIAKMQNQQQDSNNLPLPTTDNNSSNNNQKQRIIDEGEYDLDEINQMAGNYANEMYQRGLSQAQQLQNANMFSTRLEIDTPQVMSKHTFLDPKANDFNPSVADMVNRMYLNLVGFNPSNGTVANPNIRYSEFVDGYMESVDVLASQNRAESSRNIAKQVANSGMRPSGVANTEYQGNNPKKMSDKQLDEIIKDSLGF